MSAPDRATVPTADEGVTESPRSLTGRPEIAAGATSAPALDAVLVAHTHWDREWYLPFQAFRYRLVAMLDRVLDRLSSDPDFPPFMLDGQTIIVEDYLALRPERAAELRGHVRSGRLLVGPWYVLPDEFLVGGEALVRNLAVGARLAECLGGRMDVGYVPDMFGHTGQLPQILRLAGIDAAVVWRGLSDEPAELWWESPDGSRVLALYLRDGYNAAGQLPADVDGLRRVLRREIARLASHTIAGLVLLMSGDDHAGPEPDLTNRLRAASAGLPEARVRAGTLPGYLATLREALTGRTEDWPGGDDGPGQVPALPVVRGELRSSRRAPLLAGVTSARIPLKQANDATETLLTRYAEPLAAIGSLLNRLPGREKLDAAWRLLLQNHAHDSICGCAIDEVATEMETRFAASSQLAEELVRDRLAALAGSVAAPPPSRHWRPGRTFRLRRGPGDLAVTVFNPAGPRRAERVALAAPSLLPGRTYRLLDRGGRPVPLGPIAWDRRLVDDRLLDTAQMVALLDQLDSGWLGVGRVRDARLRPLGRPSDTPGSSSDLATAEVDLELVELGRADLTAIRWFSDEIRRRLAAGVGRWRVRTWLVGEARTSFIARDVPGAGYAAYRLEAVPSRGARGSARRPLGGRPAVLENDWLRVAVEPADGTLRLLDKRTGLQFEGLNRFVDGGDRGDLYSHCPPEADRVVDRPVGPPRVALLDDDPRGETLGETLEVRLRYAIQAGLAPDRSHRTAQAASLPITSRIRLSPGSARVDIETTLDNRASDHRLRVLFPTPLPSPEVLAGSAFDLVERPSQPPAGDEDWVERPVGTAPHAGFVIVRGDGRGLALATSGLPEYEVVDGKDGGAAIALTLLRCVGWLSRDDLDGCRAVPAGPGLATPGAQLPGRHTFAYAVIPFAGPVAGAIHEALAFRAPLRAVAVPPAAGPLPPAMSFVELSPDELVLSALKPADDGDGWIVRFWSTADAPIEAGLRFGFDVVSAERADLLERIVRPLEVGAGNRVRLSVGRREIVTVRVRPAPAGPRAGRSST